MLPGSISFYGASSVYGVGDSKGGFVTRFRRWYDKNRINGVVYNLGIPAENTDYLLSRFPEENARRNSHLIFFKVGANDAHRKHLPDGPNYVPIGRFEQNIIALTEIALKHAQVGFISPYPVLEDKNPLGGDSYYLNDDVHRYHNKLHEIVNKYDLVLLDLFHEWSIDDRYKRLLSSDGLHANEEGHQEIADRLVDIVQKNFSNF